MIENIDVPALNTQRRFATIPQMPHLYRVFSLSGYRALVFNAKSNGFDRCIRRVGKKILINLDQFESWLDEHQSSTVKQSNLRPKNKKGVI